jgi:hypothetical protein
MNSNNNPLILNGNNLNQSLKNIITDENTLMQLSTQNNNIFNNINGFNPNTTEGINIGINSILQEVPLKTGCCMRNQNDNTARSVQVRVELQPNAIGNLKEYGFEWKTLNIPAGTCPSNLYKGSPYCDTFFDVYCENINTVFTEQFGKQIDDSTNKYPTYAPECACYAPLAVGQESYPSGIPSACYKVGCAITDSPSYPDPISRTQPCDATICSSVINAAGLQVKGNSNINPTVVQECGQTAVTSSTGAESLKHLPQKPNYTNYFILSIISCCCLLSLFLIYFFFIKKTHRRV